MPQLVECVPNFSEGRRRDVIEAIAGEVRQTPGARVLDVQATRAITAASSPSWGTCGLFRMRRWLPHGGPWSASTCDRTAGSTPAWARWT